jgi:hypothetical protein
MIELDWDEDALRCAIKFLNVWDRKSDDFYINHKKINKYFDQTEREHYRNCVNFWRERLKYEN